MSASARRLSRATYLRLKAAARDLYDLTGGLERAAAQTRVAKTKLHAAGSISADHDTAFLAVDVIADLEQAAGEPVVTRELAHIAGYELYRLPCVEDGSKWVALLGTVSREAGEVIAALAQALQDDGAVSAREIKTLDLIGQVDGGLRALVRLREALVATVDDAAARSPRGKIEGVTGEDRS